MHPPLLVPSILAGDHARLAESAAAVERLALPWIHLDIMDGHFVPNLTFGPGTVAALRRTSGLFFDVHLMLDEPHRYVQPFARAGANLISIHVEPPGDHAAILARIRELGCQNGIVLNPGTPASAIEPLLGGVNLVLVMTVQPGFGGQSFRGDMLPKISQIVAWRRARGLDFRLEVDGGIDLATASVAVSAGANVLVAGSAIFNRPAPLEAAHALRESAKAGQR